MVWRQTRWASASSKPEYDFHFRIAEYGYSCTIQWRSRNGIIFTVTQDKSLKKDICLESLRK